MSEPMPPDIDWPRYAARPFPPYRFIKGRTPHPRRDPNGHSFGRPEPSSTRLPPEQWRRNEWYLYGIDLYNFAYWWESHEAFEALWHAAGRRTEQGRFFQGLIHVSAANLKYFLGVHHAVEKLRRTALDRFKELPSTYMGINVDIFSKDIQDYFDGTRSTPALIHLHDVESQRVRL